MAFADLIAATDVAARKHLGGVPVTYAPEEGEAVEVTGIFDASYVLVLDDGVESVAPVVWLALSDLPADPGTDAATLTIDGQDYKIRRTLKRDEMGSILLALHEVA
jgi:hypothetical protein